MLWAALVAGGVAIVSMAIFGARLTRKATDDVDDDVLPATNPDDPWAAWQPRPFEELDRPPRPRLWPVLASLTGLVLVGGGLAGARQTIQQPALATETTPEPYLIELEVTPTPTPIATPTPTPAPATPRPTAKPQLAAAQPSAAPTAAAAAKPGPTITGSASCSGGKAKLTYSVAPRDANLSWVGVYLDGKVVQGGPSGRTGHSGGHEQSVSPGDHVYEVSAEDAGGGRSRRQFPTHCA